MWLILYMTLCTVAISPDDRALPSDKLTKLTDCQLIDPSDWMKEFRETNGQDKSNPMKIPKNKDQDRYNPNFIKQYISTKFRENFREIIDELSKDTDPNIQLLMCTKPKLLEDFRDKSSDAVKQEILSDPLSFKKLVIDSLSTPTIGSLFMRGPDKLTEKSYRFIKNLAVNTGLFVKYKNAILHNNTSIFIQMLNFKFKIIMEIRNLLEHKGIEELVRAYPENFARFFSKNRLRNEICTYKDDFVILYPKLKEIIDAQYETFGPIFSTDRIRAMMIKRPDAFRIILIARVGKKDCFATTARTGNVSCPSNECFLLIYESHIDEVANYPEEFINLALRSNAGRDIAINCIISYRLFTPLEFADLFKHRTVRKAFLLLSDVITFSSRAEFIKLLNKNREIIVAQPIKFATLALKILRISYKQVNIISRLDRGLHVSTFLCANQKERLALRACNKSFAQSPNIRGEFYKWIDDTNALPSRLLGAEFDQSIHDIAYLSDVIKGVALSDLPGIVSSSLTVKMRFSELGIPPTAVLVIMRFLEPNAQSNLSTKYIKECISVYMPKTYVLNVTKIILPQDATKKKKMLKNARMSRKSDGLKPAKDDSDVEPFLEELSGHESPDEFNREYVNPTPPIEEKCASKPPTRRRMYNARLPDKNPI